MRTAAWAGAAVVQPRPAFLPVASKTLVAMRTLTPAVCDTSIRRSPVRRCASRVALDHRRLIGLLGGCSLGAFGC